MPDQLILFTRYPQPGQAKTRLIPALGDKGAADLHRQLTEHCLKQVAPLHHDTSQILTIFYTGGSERQMREWLPDIALIKQQGDTLGEKMITAFTRLQKTGKHHILLFGSDCPSLNNETIKQALIQLGSNDLVLGPSVDGGFYLIGINARYPNENLNPLLTDIAWGTDKVLRQTITRAKMLDNSYALLPTLHDIDLPEDLEHFDYHPGS
jgi:rSAM/selenodomain-associated transferase 1